LLPTLRAGNTQRARFHAAAANSAGARVHDCEQRVVTEIGGVSQEHGILEKYLPQIFVE